MIVQVPVVWLEDENFTQGINLQPWQAYLPPFTDKQPRGGGDALERGRNWRALPGALANAVGQAFVRQVLAVSKQLEGSQWQLGAGGKELTGTLKGGGVSPPPLLATQAHRGPRSQGSDHGSKSQRAGTEKRAGERLLPSRSNSTRKGTHHVVKRPDQAGRRGPARGPTHLHPTRDTTVNPTTTRSYVEVVRGVAQRSGRPATVRGPPHVTRYILLPRAPTHPPQPPSAQQRHEGEGRGFVLRSPKDGLSAGTWRRKVVMCPRRGNDPASGHPRAHQPPLGRGTSPPAWDGRLDAPGQRRRHLPSSAWTRRREVKQGKSGGSVGTTDQGKGKGRSVVRPMGTVAYRGKGQGKGKGRGEGRLGQGGRGRSKGGEKLMGTTAYGGKGSKGRAANGDRPVGAASCRRDHHTMASCQNPPLLQARPCPGGSLDLNTHEKAGTMAMYNKNHNNTGSWTILRVMWMTALMHKADAFVASSQLHLKVHIRIVLLSRYVSASKQCVHSPPNGLWSFDLPCHTEGWRVFSRGAEGCHRGCRGAVFCMLYKGRNMTSASNSDWSH